MMGPFPGFTINTMKYNKMILIFTECSIAQNISSMITSVCVKGRKLYRALKKRNVSQCFLYSKGEPIFGMIFDLAASCAFFECFLIYKGKNDDTRRLKTSYPQTFSIW